jgi:SAM-dependent methyltransferase
MTLQPAGGQITWRQADAQALPFADKTFDAVVCQFGAMFFPDRVKAYREALRVLREGGCFLFNVWDRLRENEFALVVTEALARVFPDSPPDFLARVPYGYYDVQRIGGDLADAGFTKTIVDTIEKRSRASAAKDAAAAFCQGTPLRSEVETRDASRLEEATAAAAEAIARRFGTGPIEARIRAHVVMAIP